MISNKNFDQESYKSHEGHYDDYIHGGPKEAHSKTWFEADTVDAWRHARMYRSLAPLLKVYPEANWLTVGDGRYGKDAHFIQEKGLKVLASDISEALLKGGRKSGILKITERKMQKHCLSQTKSLILFFVKSLIITFQDQ